MAKVRDYAITIYSAVTTAMVCSMPKHETGDLLVAFVNKDTNTAFTTPGGWTATQAAISAGAAGGVYCKRATSNAEAVTFALASETCCAVVIAVRDVYGSTVADAVPTSAASAVDDSTLPLAGIGLTAAYANSLLLHGLSTDSGIGANALPPWINLFAGDTGANSLCVSYSFAPTTGVIAAPNHWAGAADDSRGFMIEVRDGSSGVWLPAYLPLSTVPARQVSPLNGSAGVVDKGTWPSTVTHTLTSVNGKTSTGVVAGTAVADSGINPFRGSANIPGASSTTALSHTEFVLTAVDDLTQLQGLLFGTWQNVAPRDYVDTGTAQQGGKFLVVGNDASNYKAWVIGGQFTATEKADARNNYLIELGNSDTIYGTAGAPNFAQTDFFAFGSAGYYGAVTTRWNEMYLLGVAVLAGGSVDEPVVFNDIVFAVNNGCGILPLMQQSGSGATCWIPLQFGGVSPLSVQCSLNTFQFPRRADEVSYVDFHVSNNKVGVEFYGLSGDLISFKNCVFTSDSPYYFRFHASHSAGAVTEFDGATVVGASVTLRSVLDLEGVAFIDCPSFALNGAALDACRFQGTTVTTDNPATIINSAFISDEVRYGIEITAPGTYSFTGLTFTGFGADGTTTAAVYNNSGGAVTINVTDGDTPTVKNGSGASTTVNNSSQVTFTGLPSGTEVRVRQGSYTLAHNQDVTAGFYTYSYSVSGKPATAQFTLPGYVFDPIEVVLDSTNKTLPVTYSPDPSYV